MAGSIFSDDFQTAIPSNDVMKQLLALSSMQEATDYTPIATGLKSIGKVFTDAEDAMLKDNTATARRAIQSINPQQMVKLLDKGIDPVQTLYNAGLTFNPDDAGLMSAYEKHREQSINDVTNQWVAKLDSIPHNEWVEYIQGKKPDLFEQHGMTPWTRLPLSLRQAVASKLENVKKSEFYKSLFNGSNLADVTVEDLEGIDGTTLKAMGENFAKLTQDRNAYLGRSADVANGLISSLDNKTQQFVNEGVKTFIKNFMTNYAGVFGEKEFNLDKLTDEDYDTLTEGIDPTIKDFVISQVKRLHAAGALRPMFDTHVTTDYSEANYGQKLIYDKDFANEEGRVDDPLTFLENHPFMTWYRGLPTTEAGRAPILKSVTDNYGAAMYQDTLNNNPEYVKHILQDKDAMTTLAQKEKADLELIDQYGVDKDSTTFAKLSTQAYYANLRKLASDSREKQKVENRYSTNILGRQLIEEAPEDWLKDTAAVIGTREPLKVTDRYKKLPNAKLQIITEAVANSRLSKIYPTQEKDRKLFAQFLCENILSDKDVQFSMDTVTPEDLRSFLKKNKEAYDNNAVLDFLTKLFKYHQAATARKSDEREQTGQDIIDKAPKTPEELKRENAK